jgi:hypothetical protein
MKSFPDTFLLKLLVCSIPAPALRVKVSMASLFRALPVRN